MQEIGGYIELEHFHGSMLHEGLLQLNCGRSCLRYLIRQKRIRKIVLPFFCCDSVRHVCEQEHVEVRYFSINRDWMPVDVTLRADEWLYVVNYYGQLTKDQVYSLYRAHDGRVILDEAQAYFEEPLPGIDTLYTCRKFYGVADGAFLSTDAPYMADLPQDESHERMHFLLGRFERPASEFYREYADNNDFFDGAPIKNMSKLTMNILRGADDDFIRERRTDNFRILHAAFGDRNELQGLRVPEGAFAYPLMVSNGAEVRRKLVLEKFYIPILWPNVLDDAEPGTWDYELAKNVLPLPVDQRYGEENMEALIHSVKKYL